MKYRVRQRLLSVLLSVFALFAALPAITLPVSAEMSISVGNAVLISQETDFVFIPTVSGLYSFYSTDITSGDPVGYLFNANHNQIASNDDSGSTRNFNITYELTAGTTYYLRATFFNSIGSYTVMLEGPYRTITPSSSFAVIAPTWFVFTPTFSGRYRFYSTANTSGDPYGYLYDADHNLLTYNDDSYNTSDFSVEYELTADTTYYLKASFYGSVSGNYTVKMEGPYQTIASGGSFTVTSPTDFVFTPTVSGRYCFYSTDITSGDPVGYIYDADHNQVAYGDDSGSTRNFNIEYQLTAGTTYYLKAAFYSVSGRYTVKLEGPYCTITAGSSLTVTEPTYYVFTPFYSGTYFFYSSGITTGDPNAYLYGSDHTQLAYNDDNSGSKNFLIQYELTAGTTYYLKASFYNKNGGSYTANLMGPSEFIEPLYIAQQPAGKELHVSGSPTTTLSVMAAGGCEPYSYQWQYSDNGTSFIDFNGGDAAYGKNRSESVSVFVDRIRYYRCTVTDAIGTTVVTNVVSLVNYPLRTVTVYGNGADSASTGSFTVTSSQPGGMIAAPEREGYTFGGWYYDIDCTEAYDPAALITANVSVYGKWERISLTVTVYGDGSEPTDSFTVCYGEAGGTLAAPEKTGFTFGGWYYDTDFAEAYDPAALVTANVSVYAKWTRNTLTLVFFEELNGSRIVGTRSVLYGNAGGEGPVPQKEGYRFLGWYTDTDRTVAYDPTAPVYGSGSVLVYGKWERISLTVTVYGDGSEPTDSFTVYYGEAGGALAAPEREGYTFGGWYYDIDCTEAYDPAALVTANVSVYAKWTENEPITPPVGLIGDVNGDGTVSINDVSALLNYLATASTEGVVVANLDVNGDAGISISDVSTLLNILAG